MARPLVPQPGYYAVIRIDPEAMVTDLGLDDTETIEECRRMSRKKYLVYLEWPEELPMPDMRWCRYEVSPIGTTLRPTDEARGITSNMVAAITPNKHPLGECRAVHATPSFPFGNCYHWAMNSKTVRIRVHEDGVDHEGAVSLPPQGSYALKKIFSHDCQHVSAFIHEKYGSPASKADATGSSTCAGASCGDDTLKPGLLSERPFLQDAGRIDILTDTYYRLVTQRGLRRSGPPSETDMSDSDSGSSHDRSSEDVSGSREARKQSTVTAMTLTLRDPGIDLFGWDPDPNTAKIPLVDAWLDLNKHLTADEIPSPLDLEEEIEETNAIVMRALARFASAQSSPEKIKDEHPVSAAELPSEPGELADNDHWLGVLEGLW